MIVGLDSAMPPTPAQADVAKAAGIAVWSGYLATKPNVGLYHPWSLLDFQAAKRCGGTPIGYASGWDDPAACKNLAAAWNVRLCLDVESGIRGDGAWVQPWLNASGAGLYGNRAVHSQRVAAFHILSWYVSDPNASWYGARPSTPCGWQWRNSLSEFGVTVDRCWLDDWFAAGQGGNDMDVNDPNFQALIWRVKAIIDNEATISGGPQAGSPNALHAELEAIKAALKALPPGSAPSYQGTVTLTPK